jgi:hypothetical protein
MAFSKGNIMLKRLANCIVFIQTQKIRETVQEMLWEGKHRNASNPVDRDVIVLIATVEKTPSTYYRWKRISSKYCCSACESCSAQRSTKSFATDADNIDYGLNVPPWTKRSEFHIAI